MEKKYAEIPLIHAIQLHLRIGKKISGKKEGPSHFDYQKISNSPQQSPVSGNISSILIINH